MNELMLEYISEQGSLVKKMTDERSDIAGPFLKRFGSVKPRRIIMFGSGSSYHAACIARPFIERALGVEARAEVPSHLETAELLLDFDSTVFFVLSQGGKSASTVLKQRELAARGAKCIAITENDDTLIARESALSVSLRIGHEEIGAKTKGVSATVLTLMLLALEWGKALGALDNAFAETFLKSLETASRQLPENIKRSDAWYVQNRDTLKNAEHIAVLGTKADHGTALEFALKLLETIYRPVTAYEFEEFLHGGQNMLSAKSYLLLLLPDTEQEQKPFLALHEFCKSIGAKSYLIARGKSIDNTTLNLLNSGNPYLSFLEFLIPGQLLSASLSAYCGIDISKSKFPGFTGQFDLHVL